MLAPSPSSSLPVFAPGPLSALSVTSDFSHAAVVSNHKSIHLTRLPATPPTDLDPHPISPANTTSASSASSSSSSSPQQSFQFLSCPSSCTLSAVSYPDVSCLYVADTRGFLNRYDPSSLSTTTTTTSSASASSPAPTLSIPAAHSGAELTCVQALHPSAPVFTGGKDGVIRCWDPSTSQSVAKLTGHRYDVRELALAYDGDGTQTHVSVVASAGRDRTVRLWDVRSSNSLIATLEGHAGWVHDVAILGVGTPSSSTSYGDSITSTMTTSSTADGSTDAGAGASAADPVVVSCSGDKTVRVWDMRTLRQRALFRGHQYRIWAVDVASSPRFAASASTDASIRLWDLASSIRHGDNSAANGSDGGLVLEGHTDSVLALAVRPDGRIIVSACEDGTLYAWNGAMRMNREKVDAEENNISVNSNKDNVTLQQESLIDVDTVPTTTTGSSSTLAPSSVLSVPNLTSVGTSTTAPITTKTTARGSAVVVPKHVDLNAATSSSISPLIPLPPPTSATATTATPDQDPGYDKSAAELVRALTRIQQLEASLKDAERRAAEHQRAVTALRTEVARRDETVRKLQKQVDTMKKLDSAVHVHQLLQTNRRKADVRREGDEAAGNDENRSVVLNSVNGEPGDSDNEFTEPVNKIGAVSDQLSKLAARLDAMIATS